MSTFFQGQHMISFNKIIASLLVDTLFTLYKLLTDGSDFSVF